LLAASNAALVVVRRCCSDRDLRPGPDAHVVVVVGVGLEPRQPGLIDDAGGVVRRSARRRRCCRRRRPRAGSGPSRRGRPAPWSRSRSAASGRDRRPRPPCSWCRTDRRCRPRPRSERGPERGVQLGRERVRRVSARCRARAARGSAAMPLGVVPTQPPRRRPAAAPSSSTHARQPVRGGSRSHAPSVQSATFRSQPAQSPVAPLSDDVSGRHRRGCRVARSGPGRARRAAPARRASAAPRCG
jgi:hypothetical protein